MCFSKKQWFKPRIKTARADIVCYKKVWWSEAGITAKPELYSNTGYVYEINKLSPRVNLNIFKGNLFIDGGESWCVEEGYHSYIKSNIWYVNAKCIIPKRTKYFKNKKNNTYVSEQIIIKKQIRREYK